MKKLFLISAILFVAITSSFAFQPTHGQVVVTAVTGESKSQTVVINLNCEVYVWVTCTTYGVAGVTDLGSNHLDLSGIPGAYLTKSELWNSNWGSIILHANAAYGGPNTPIGANTAGIVW